MRSRAVPIRGNGDQAGAGRRADRRSAGSGPRRSPGLLPGPEALEGRRLLAGLVAEYDIPGPAQGPGEIAAGPDGNLWFTLDGGAIGRITTAGVVTEFPLPDPASAPSSIAAGPDGALWFTEGGAAKIGRITTAGVVTEFPLPSPDRPASRIAAGPDGNLWFTEFQDNQLGRITPGGAVTEFAIPGPGRLPGAITGGPDGNVWFTLSDGTRVGRITPGGEVATFPANSSSLFPGGIATGPDGKLWFTFQDAGVGASPVIGRITTAGASDSFPIPPPPNAPGANLITSGPDNALWFTETAGNQVVRITTTGAVTEFPLPTPGSRPDGIATGSDGNLWFTEGGTNKIGKLSPPPPEPPAPPTPTRITVLTSPNSPVAGQPVSFSAFVSSDSRDATPDGSVAFAVDGGAATLVPLAPFGSVGATATFSVPLAAGPHTVIASYGGSPQFGPSAATNTVNVEAPISIVSPFPGAITEYPVTAPYTDAPTNITLGPDGNLWFTRDGGMVGRITTAGAVTQFPVPSGLGTLAITAGPDGNLWFTEAGGMIGRITPGGVVTEFPVNSPIGQLGGITAGPDGNLWFAEGGSNKIGRITTAGVVTEFAIPGGNPVPVGIATGPDGNLWFTESLGNAIGRITTSGVITEFPLATPGRFPGGIATLAGITTGPDGALWFIEGFGNALGRITTAGVITEVPYPAPDSSPSGIPGQSSQPGGITTGPDGNLWITESLVGDVARITTSGAITRVPTPSAARSPVGIISSYPGGITTGPDGNLWFTEGLGNIGKLVPSAIIAPPTVVGLQRFGFHAEPTRVVLAFSSPLDPARAQDLRNYRIVGPDGKAVAIASATYDPASGTVTLRPRARLDLHRVYQLTVVGIAPGGVASTSGVPLGGAGNGQPGSDYVATLKASDLVLRSPVPGGPARLAAWKQELARIEADQAKTLARPKVAPKAHASPRARPAKATGGHSAGKK